MAFELNFGLWEISKTLEDHGHKVYDVVIFFAGIVQDS